MRIIQIIASYKPAYIYGGPIMSVAKLCEALIKRIDSLRVLTTTANGKHELPVNVGVETKVDNVPVTYFPRITKDHTHFSPKLLLALHNELKLNKKNNVNDLPIIHIHAWWNLVSIFSCQIAKWHKVPVLLTPRGMLTKYTLGNRNSLMKRLIHFSIGERLLNYCHIHATSEKEKLDVLENFKPKGITVIPNLVELHLIHETSNSLPADIFKLIFLSRIEEKKGLELLFKALSLTDISWSLTIAGTGEEVYIRKLKELSRSLNISNHIKWLGHVDKNIKFKLLREHDMLALTSYNENFANVIIESLSVGTPVLISNHVGLFDYVKQHKFGWVTSLDEKDIALQINLAYQAVNHRLEIRQFAPDIIVGDFNEDKLINQYLDLYQKLSQI